METLIQDLRYGIRMILKHPGFTAVAVLSLALGIGANTAIFSLINAVLLRMLPVNNPEQLVLLTVVGQRGTNYSFSYPLYEQLRDRTQSCSGIFASANAGRARLMVNESGASGETELVQAERVSGNYFSVLGVGAVLGRTLTEDDDRAGNPRPVAVISHGFWKRRFGLDPAVVGKNIFLSDVPFTIIGVAPPGFSGFEVGSNPDLWWPLQMLPQVSPGNQMLTQSNAWWLRLMGRLKPGASASQARAEMDVVFQQMLSEMAVQRASRWTPTERRNFMERRIELQPGATGYTSLRQQATQPLVILMIVVGLVLLIACANVANLLLARAAARQKEIAVRLALGAGRLRLLRQLLTESVLMAAIGGLLGLLFAHWGTRLLLLYLPQRGGTLALNLNPDARVLGFTMAVSLLTGLLFGLAPALRATRLDLHSALKERAGTLAAGRSRLGLNKLLVVSQVALSLFLLIGAGLFVRSLQNLKSLDAGFDREHVALFSIDTGNGYDTARRVSLYKQVLQRLEALPGARAASISNITPITNSSWTDKIAVEGYSPQLDEDVSCNALMVGPKFFEAMGIPLLLGRDFGPQDEQAPAETSGHQAGGGANQNAAPRAPRAGVINQALARYFFGNTNPIGKRFSFGGGTNSEPVEIIGVVKDAKYRNLREPPPRTFYVSYFQRPSNMGMGFELRTVGNPAGVAAAIRRTVQEIDKKLQVLDLRTMEEIVDESLTQERFLAHLAGFFSLFALLLACVGLYGIMSYAVVRRTSEIGIRMALGAERGDVIWLVMRETMWLVLVGVAIGLPAALAITRLVSSLLYGLTATDPVTVSLATVLMMAVAAFAGYLPARRASRVDPMVALRYE